MPASTLRGGPVVQLPDDSVCHKSSKQLRSGAAQCDGSNILQVGGLAPLGSKMRSGLFHAGGTTWETTQKLQQVHLSTFNVDQSL